MKNIGDRCLCSEVEPAMVKDGNGEESGGSVMTEELGSIEENQTWSLVDLPSGHNAIGLKWVFKVNNDPMAQSTSIKLASLPRVLRSDTASTTLAFRSCRQTGYHVSLVVSCS